MKTVLFIHQSAELYGSDKTLLILLRRLDKSRFTPIVLLPEEGPLSTLLRGDGIEVHSAPLVKLAQKTFSVKGLATLPGQIIRSVLTLNRILGKRNIDVAHTNTLAVIGGAVWARWRKIPHIWHVHEITTRPRMAGPVFAWLVRLLADWIACNSHATRDFLIKQQGKLANKSSVIWNGLDRIDPASTGAVQDLRQSLGLGKESILVTLVGRINRWKGHLFITEVIAALKREHPNLDLHLLIVGSPPAGQSWFQDDLIQRAKQLGVEEQITILGFRESIWPVWDATDIAVVPSTEPEPFGMVTLEAMLAGKPVIASAAGGLVDIVEPGITGLLVPPGDVEAWSKALLHLAGDASARKALGHEGKARALTVFSESAYVSGFESLYERLAKHAGH